MVFYWLGLHICAVLKLLQSVCACLFSLDFVKADGQVVDAIHREFISGTEGIEQRNLGYIEYKEPQLKLPAGYFDSFLFVCLATIEVEVKVTVVHHKHVEVLLVIVAQLPFEFVVYTSPVLIGEIELLEERVHVRGISSILATSSFIRTSTYTNSPLL